MQARAFASARSNRSDRVEAAGDGRDKVSATVRADGASETRRREWGSAEAGARTDERGGRLLLLLRGLLDGACVLLEHVVRLVALGLEHLRRVQHVQQLRVVHLEQHARDLAG